MKKIWKLKHNIFGSNRYLLKFSAYSCSIWLWFTICRILLNPNTYKSSICICLRQVPWLTVICRLVENGHEKLNIGNLNVWQHHEKPSRETQWIWDTLYWHKPQGVGESTAFLDGLGLESTRKTSSVQRMEVVFRMKDVVNIISWERTITWNHLKPFETIIVK